MEHFTVFNRYYSWDTSVIQWNNLHSFRLSTVNHLRVIKILVILDCSSRSRYSVVRLPGSGHAQFCVNEDWHDPERYFTYQPDAWSRSTSQFGLQSYTTASARGLWFQNPKKEKIQKDLHSRKNCWMLTRVCVCKDDHILLYRVIRLISNFQF